jgi:hypothetical protein
MSTANTAAEFRSRNMRATGSRSPRRTAPSLNTKEKASDVPREEAIREKTLGQLLGAQPPARFARLTGVSRMSRAA